MMMAFKDLLNQALGDINVTPAPICCTPCCPAQLAHFLDCESTLRPSTYVSCLLSTLAIQSVAHSLLSSAQCLLFLIHLEMQAGCQLNIQSPVGHGRHWEQMDIVPSYLGFTD